jgi:ribosome-binding factor A
MREFTRSERIADYLRRELGLLIQREMRDPRVFMTSVTEVEVSRDFSHAKVYVTVLGKDTAEEAKEAVTTLNKAAGFLRTQIAKNNTARTTPQLRFHYDSSVNRGQQLSALIDKAMASDASRQGSEPEESSDSDSDSSASPKED